MQAAAAQVATSQVSDARTQQDSLSIRWYLPEAPSVTPHRMSKSPSPYSRSTDRQNQYGTDQAPYDRDTFLHNDAKALHSDTDKRSVWSVGTRTQILVSSSLLCVYFVLLALGY